MYRKSMYVHGASQGNSETERVLRTQIPSPKPSELVTFLVAGAKHLAESNFWKEGFILTFFGECGQSTFARKARRQEQEAVAHSTAAVGKRGEEGCRCSAACFLLLFQPRIPASARCSVPMVWVSTSVNSPWKHPHRCARRCKVRVVLNPAKLARREAGHHITV